MRILTIFLSVVSSYCHIMLCTTSPPSSPTVLLQLSRSSPSSSSYNEAINLSSRGNHLASRRLLSKITADEPSFVGAHALLGNDLTALGDLDSALDEYTTTINLCEAAGSGKCKDLWLDYVNRGAVLNNLNSPERALSDLNEAARLRARPELTILSNRARAKENQGDFIGADADYTIAMGLNGEVAPFWLRAALAKFEVGECIGETLSRVEGRFPDAPEVVVLRAILQAEKLGDEKGKEKFGKLPESQKRLFSDEKYVKEKIGWGPKSAEAAGRLADGWQ